MTAFPHTVLHDPYELLFTCLAFVLAHVSAAALLEIRSQVRSSSRRGLLFWWGFSPVAVGFAIFQMQLCAIRVASTVPVAAYNFTYLAAALLIAIADIIGVTFLASGSQHRRQARFIESLLSGLAIVAMNLLILNGVHGRMHHMPLALWVTLSLALSVFTSHLVFRLATVGNLGPATAWRGYRYTVAIGFASFAVNYLWPGPISFSGDMPQQYLVAPNGNALVITVGALVALLGLGAVLIGASMQRRLRLQLADKEATDERSRVMSALTDQRVIRLENDALSNEIRERKKIEAELLFVAFHDNVTQLHNRAYLMRLLEQVVGKKEGCRDGLCTYVLYIDLDNFKTVNDTTGHRVGDQLLAELARRLEACTRSQDTIARMGGDEFTLVYVGGRSMGSAVHVAERVLGAIEQPITISGMRFSVTASIGICQVDTTYHQPEDILRDADAAMYCAKHRGGNTYAIYDPSMHAAALSALQARMELKEGVERNEFELYYQPLVKMHDRSIYGMEALIRWNHPTRGLVGPLNFIPLAEETGHILFIGMWTLKQGLKDIQKMEALAGRRLFLSLNVSSRQLDEASFFDSFRQVIEASGVDPKCLQLEITESIFLKDAERIGGVLGQFRALGIKVAFDDFGTGYSSLSYLQKYPVDTLKIDQSFVRNMKGNCMNADIIRFVINLAHATGMSTSAEGVEEPDQEAALLHLGCSLAQGYLYSRPVPLQKMIELIEHGLDVPTLTAV